MLSVYPQPDLESFVCLTDRDLYDIGRAATIHSYRYIFVIIVNVTSRYVLVIRHVCIRIISVEEYILQGTSMV